LLSFFAALLARRGKAAGLPRFLPRLFDAASIATNSIPGMVLGVAYLITFAGTALQNTLAIMVACTVVHLFSTPYLMFSGAFARLNSSWEVTAELLHDRWLATIGRILVPNVLACAFEVFGYYFIYTMVTISGVVFLVSAYTMLITTKINQLAYFARFDDIFVLSLAICALNLAARLVTRFGARRAHKRLGSTTLEEGGAA
jgi:iron(III) transport system permease protein